MILIIEIDMEKFDGRSKNMQLGDFLRYHSLHIRHSFSPITISIKNPGEILYLEDRNGNRIGKVRAELLTEKEE
jgi:hypothetical protein